MVKLGFPCAKPELSINRRPLEGTTCSCTVPQPIHHEGDSPSRRRAGRFPGRFGKREQTDCKPGSVASCPRTGRSRWPFIWDARRRAPRAINPGGGVREPNLQGMPPLLDLAPGGVCRAVPVAGDAVRSCRTLSPLPPDPAAVCSLWHFPWGRPRRALPGAMFPWSPDFPPRPGRPAGNAAAIRPSVPWKQADSPAPRRRQSTSATRPASRARVSPSAAPSTLAGRKCLWNAVTTSAVLAPKRPSTAMA